jgi:hypothetical protein
MAESRSVIDRRPDLSHVKGRAIRAELSPSFSQPRTERRNVSSRRALARRVHGEFLEMPGLTLSIERAARLFSLPATVCARVFGELIAGGCLRASTDGRYTRLNNSMRRSD